MCFYLGAILLFLILLLFALLFLLFRRHAIRKVNMMSETEKETLLSSLTRPAGFSYLPDQDIFVTMADSWQRELGYCHFYDTAAPLGNMIFECEPVYFDYEDHTWLIEFWKGQYGINTGAEIGIYRADTLLSPRDYQKTLFHAVSDEEMPYFEQTLFRNKTSLFQQYDKTWWLAGFRMGLFSDPKHLSTDVSVTFHSVDMRNAFLDALEQLGYRTCDLCVQGRTVAIHFGKPKSLQPIRAHSFLYQFTQWKNRLFTRIYLRFTRPFTTTADRLLYLYYFLPRIFQRMIRIRKHRKERRSL